MTTISLVMIVKNEEKVLERSIQSVAPIIDEFIIVDTGSSDKTKDIIKKYGKVLELPFTNYVDTKNEALKLATSDYIILLDADEYVVSGVDKLRTYADSQLVECVSAQIIEGNDRVIANAYFRNRMWRNDGKWKYEGPGVHEVLCGPGPIIYDKEIKVRHDHSHREKEDIEIVTQRFWSYTEILKNFLKDHPNDGRALFYLARTYKDLGKTSTAITIYEKYLELNTDFIDERWQAAYDIAQCYKSEGEYDKAMIFCEKAVTIDSRRAEAYNLKGFMYYSMQDWEKAIECYEKSLEQKFPEDVTLFINPQEYDQIPLDNISICYDRVGRYKEARECMKKCLDVSQAVDMRVVNNLCWMNSFLQRKIFMALGYTPEPVFGGILKTQGVHGLETTYIELSKELVKLGHTVFLFCRCDEEHIYDGVYYVPYQKINDYLYLSPDVLITSRWFYSLYLENSSKKIIWFQDAHFADPERPDAKDKASLFVCSSKWHRQYIAERYVHSIDAKKLHIIPLGINKELYINSIEKDLYKVVYSSNPDRGLYILIDMWKELSEKIDGIHLDIYYGWEGLKTWSDNKDWQDKIEAQYKSTMEKLDEFNNIKFKGRLTKRELANEVLSATLCLYPNNFVETFCLVALEMQAAGVPMITTDQGALATTLKNDCNILLRLDPYSIEYKNKFIEETVALFNDRERLNLWSYKCRNHIMEGKWDWSDIAKTWEKLILKN